jgi:hypothetical protein
MSKRGLTPFEVEEARLVFAGSLDTTPIVVHENVAWPDRVAALGAGFHGDTPPSHNAITLGNHIYFPVEVRTDPAFDGDITLGRMAWLIHELTHSWQYQHRGIGYFYGALWAQIRLGSDAYAYGWEAGLEQALANGDLFLDFNPEQQGEIARHFYYRLKQGLDTIAWRPWIQAIQATI